MFLDKDLLMHEWKKNLTSLYWRHHGSQWGELGRLRWLFIACICISEICFIACFCFHLNVSLSPFHVPPSHCYISAIQTDLLHGLFEFFLADVALETDQTWEMCCTCSHLCVMLVWDSHGDVMDLINGLWNADAWDFFIIPRDPAVWKNPEEFDPSRFMDNEDLPDPYTYLPFSTGPHKCLGHQFAKMQMKLVLSLLIRDFTFEMLPGAKYVRKMAITLFPSPPVRLMVKVNWLTLLKLGCD